MCFYVGQLPDRDMFFFFFLQTVSYTSDMHVFIYPLKEESPKPSRSNPEATIPCLPFLATTPATATFEVREEDEGHFPLLRCALGEPRQADGAWPLFFSERELGMLVFRCLGYLFNELGGWGFRWFALLVDRWLLGIVGLRVSLILDVGVASRSSSIPQRCSLKNKNYWFPLELRTPVTLDSVLEAFDWTPASCEVAYRYAEEFEEEGAKLRATRMENLKSWD